MLRARGIHEGAKRLQLLRGRPEALLKGEGHPNALDLDIDELAKHILMEHEHGEAQRSHRRGQDGAFGQPPRRTQCGGGARGGGAYGG